MTLEEAIDYCHKEKLVLVPTEGGWLIRNVYDMDRIVCSTIRIEKKTIVEAVEKINKE